MRSGSITFSFVSSRRVAPVKKRTVDLLWCAEFKQVLRKEHGSESSLLGNYDGLSDRFILHNFPIRKTRFFCQKNLLKWKYYHDRSSGKTTIYSLIDIVHFITIVFLY